MATWSAPGKVFLFGEHAVVYGKPGVAMAIKPRVFVTVRKSRNPTRPKSPYIDECFKRMGVRGSVYVNSQLQSSSGLGSSAAVTVATLCAINDEFNLGRTREDIADIAYSIEKKVQKGRASPTDTYVCTNGGMVLITGNSKRRLPPQGLQIVVGNTLVPHSTARMVELVGDLQRKHPEIANPILDAIGAVTLAALHNINNPKDLGQCMDMNNALLEALGVGHPASSKLVLAARASGAYGAKITGAGGGGCIIALCPRRVKSRVAGAIEACEGKAIITTIDTDGARKEKHD
ncbi:MULTISPECIES: mevalonate kinase [unclassified Methanoculleus]|uniref:mevalonate kinase n=1 Tax=unclassified Methanoculleus TaxID=2619537 RepID=UPI0025DB8862|nr:mevalonate kinase [Methanoculleus sp. UBA303]MCE5337632.1 mevalonate kinase [Methanomicrobiaceae archaeon]MDD3932424.1 mevalonate kinase [Methanoculleus sp.]